MATVASTLFLAACGDDGGSRGEQAADAAQQAGLDEPVVDFMALAASAPDAVFRVTYEAVDESGEPVTVTVTQDPPDSRIDVATGDGGSVSTITTGGERYQCTTGPGDTAPRCTTAGPAPGASAGTGGQIFTADALRALTDALLDRRDDYDFSVEDRPIAGVEARCLVTQLRPGRDGGEEGTLCVSPEGAQLLIAVPRGRMSAISYTTDIPTDAFELPADP
jgi:hypothetical protein